MENMEVAPANFPPSAVLIVRQLLDPLPKCLNLSLSFARIDSTWERAVQNKLSEFYRQAARPNLGLVPANAVAVVFSDEAEMLACLTLDLIRGEAAGHWWWRNFLRNMPYSTADNVTKLLCERPTLVPAILHQLAERGQAETVVANLSPEQALRILTAVNRAYALPDLPQDKLGFMPSGIPYSNNGETGQDRTSAFASFTTKYRIDGEMPWNHWLPSGSVPACLPKEKACLLGVGLTLQRAPTAVRSEFFLQKLRAWWMAPSLSPPPLTEFSTVAPSSITQPQLAYRRPIAPGSPKSQETGVAKIAIGEQTTPQSAESPSDAGSMVAITVASTPDSQISLHESQSDKANPLLLAASQLNPMSEPSSGPTTSPVARISLSETSSTAPAALPHAEHQENLEDEPLFSGEGVDTQLGGVLYLINLMTQLNLPQCFEEEWGLASHLGAWGVLDILARALFDEPDESLCHDPLWQALAELDGREPDELPGKSFQGSEHFYLPATWLKYVDDDAEGAYAWAADGSRYCLWSGQGYVLAEDVHINPWAALNLYFHNVPVNLSEQPYNNAPIAKLSSPLLTGLNPDLCRWLVFVIPYVRLRLQQALRGALGLNALLLHSGRMYLTSTHVDLVLSLNSISIPVRMAGFDLNPGWVPDFGRIVLFHYE
jgi:hypothetical protein